MAQRRSLPSAIVSSTLTHNRSPRPRYSPWRIGQLTLLVAFAILYFLTLDTGLQPYELRGGDLITHQYAQVQARPSNAPGYPLYTVGGWLWFHGLRSLLSINPFAPATLPPNPMPLLSSYSTLWALLALWLMLALAERMAGAQHRDDPFAALVASLVTAFFGLTYFFWYYATTTEQYSSAVAQTLAILLAYLWWRRAPQRLFRLFWLAFLCGMSLAHMLTVAFIVPPLVVVVVMRAPWLLRSWRAVAGAIAAAFLPLTAYAYVWWRGAYNPQWWGRGDWESPQAWFWSFVGTAQGREELGWGFEAGRAFFGNGFPEIIGQELSVPLLVIGLAGIALLPRQMPRVLYGTLAIYLAFCWAYRYGNWFQVILPAYPLILLGILPVVLRVRDAVRSHRPGLETSAKVAIVMALLLAVGWRANASLPAANSRDRADDTALLRAADLAAQSLPLHAHLFAAVDDALALNYLIHIWGLRTDLNVVSSSEASRRLSTGAPVFATYDAVPTLLAEIDQAPWLIGTTPDWVELRLEQPPTPDAPPLAVIDDALALVAVDVAPARPPVTTPHAASPGLDVTLTWRTDSGSWPDGLAISLRVLTPDGPYIDATHGELFQIDRPGPIHGVWRAPHATEPVAIIESYRLPVGASPNVDALWLVLYHQSDDGFVNVADFTVPLAVAP